MSKNKLSPTDIQYFISKGESLTVEFKESKTQPNKDVYETVCAFLNRAGGDIFLGIKDDGTIVGINEEAIENIKKDFVTTINNPQKFSPPLYLNIETLEIEDKNILHIEVPVSASVHTLNGKIYDRNNDSDINITGQNANIPHFYGELNPSNFMPFPKNPNIAKVFREIGFADELGSGVKNLYKYSKAYGGSDPVIVEGEVFRVEVQTPTQAAQETAQETAQENTKDKILELLRQNPKYTKADLMQILNKADGTIKEHITNLKKDGKLARIGSTKSGYWEVHDV